MALNDIYQFRFRCVYDDVIDCYNVFYYQSLGLVDVTTPMNDIAHALILKLYTPLAAVITAQVLISDSYVKNLNTLEEGAFSTDGTTVGTKAGDALPPFNAYSFIYRRANATTRHGHKRFAGVPELQQAQGVITDPGTLGQLNDLAAALQAPLDDGEGLNASAELWPIIYSQYLNGELRPTPVVNLVTSVAYTGIGSQNSRKR